MDAPGLRDVFRCITLSIAAMEDIGLLPKPYNDPPRPTVAGTFGLNHIPQDHLHITGSSKMADMEEEEPSKTRSHSVLIAEPRTTPQFSAQHPQPLGDDTTLFSAAVKNGIMNLNKAVVARKSQKAKVRDPSKWKQNRQKQLRMEGKAYVSKRKKDGELVTKQPRAMGPRCASSACKKASTRLCSEIDEEARKNVFDEFWQHMNWAQRKRYVAGQVDCDPVERSRAVGSWSRRSVSLRYHLVVDGERKQVCKNMFLSTLGLGEWSVLSWAQKGVNTNESELETSQAVPQCLRQSRAPPAVNDTVKADQERVNANDEDGNRPPELEGPARKKPRIATPLMWKQNRQKQLRMEGKSYISKRKKDGATITKAQRTMGPRCSSSACKKASNRFCAEFTEETRCDLFASFWQRMNWTQRKTYVSGLVDCDPVERTRAPWTQSRRSVSMRYHLISNGDRKQVCKRMFLSTLGVGEWSVLNWAQNASQQNHSEESTKKQTQRTSRKASEHIVLKEFLESLPKVSSYCRGASLSKLYLEPVFSNMSEVYRRYYDHCSENKTTPLSRQVFCAVFKRMDLGLCDPKKDQGCSFSVTGNLFDDLWEEYCMERGASGVGPEKGANQ